MRLIPALPDVSRFLPLFVSALLAAAPSTSGAAPPSPIDEQLWAFPGAGGAPPSAMSAGFALADRWLGDQPYDNPAALPERGVVGSGVLQRVSRQDLRADNRQVDEQGAFIDFSGALLAAPIFGFGVVAYAYQPVLRLESNAFARGEVGAPVQPAIVTSNGSSRELRAGLAVSHGWGDLRGGIAGEFHQRSDTYELSEQSGSPDQGLRHVDFSGSAFGAQAGIRYGEDRPQGGAFTFGIAARLVPAITVEGEQSYTLLSGDSLATVSAERESAIEAGASASYRIGTTFRFIAGAGGRTARDWVGFGVRSGTAFQWSVAGEFHDDRDPWTLRFGAGQEREDDVVEERAGLIGLGIGWSFDRSRLDFGLLHRTINRADSPTSYDDRVVASVTAAF